MKISPEDRIIFPLDLPTMEEALKFVKLLKDRVGVFKVGLELFTRYGPASVDSVKENAPGKKIFLDLKFHDIPETVKGAMRAVSSLGADFITVHCDEGRGLLKAVVEAKTEETEVLGVTLLTSLSQEDLADIGIDHRYRNPVDLVLHRARLARLAGCSGVVCSGLEAKAVREEFGHDFVIVTPGIRSPEDSRDDQKRTVTPYEAIYTGADYIVVGRPIRKASDPVQAAKKIADEIKKAVKEKEK